MVLELGQLGSVAEPEAVAHPQLEGLLQEVHRPVQLPQAHGDDRPLPGGLAQAEAPLLQGLQARVVRPGRLFVPEAGG